ncbi:hypothetical protein HK405_012944, partial [Cladochytrium tenue]
SPSEPNLRAVLGLIHDYIGREAMLSMWRTVVDLLDDADEQDENGVVSESGAFPKDTFAAILRATGVEPPNFIPGVDMASEDLEGLSSMLQHLGLVLTPTERSACAKWAEERLINPSLDPAIGSLAALDALCPYTDDQERLFCAMRSAEGVLSLRLSDDSAGGRLPACAILAGISLSKTVAQRFSGRAFLPSRDGITPSAAMTPSCIEQLDSLTRVIFSLSLVYVRPKSVTGQNMGFETGRAALKAMLVLARSASAAVRLDIWLSLAGMSHRASLPYNQLQQVLAAEFRSGEGLEEAISVAVRMAERHPGGLPPAQTDATAKAVGVSDRSGTTQPPNGLTETQKIGLSLLDMLQKWNTDTATRLLLASVADNLVHEFADSMSRDGAEGHAQAGLALSRLWDWPRAVSIARQCVISEAIAAAYAVVEKKTRKGYVGEAATILGDGLMCERQSTFTSDDGGFWHCGLEGLELLLEGALSKDDVDRCYEATVLASSQIESATRETSATAVTRLLRVLVQQATTPARCERLVRSVAAALSLASRVAKALPVVTPETQHVPPGSVFFAEMEVVTLMWGAVLEEIAAHAPAGECAVALVIERACEALDTEARLRRERRLVRHQASARQRHPPPARQDEDGGGGGGADDATAISVELQAEEAAEEHRGDPDEAEDASWAVSAAWLAGLAVSCRRLRTLHSQATTFADGGPAAAAAAAAAVSAWPRLTRRACDAALAAWDDARAPQGALAAAARALIAVRGLLA